MDRTQENLQTRNTLTSCEITITKSKENLILRLSSPTISKGHRFLLVTGSIILEMVLLNLRESAEHVSQFTPNGVQFATENKNSIDPFIGTFIFT